MLYRFKPDEGRNARQTAFWLGEGMLFFGCYALSGTLSGFDSLASPLVESMPSVPLLGIPLTGGFLVAAAVFLVGSFLYLRYLAADKIAQHLIEVEEEMQKVTWPTFEDATNSSIVVIVTVLILLGFLALSDLVLGEIFKVILWGGFGGA
jgi:preprotein translocase SecE subunit